MVQHSIFGKHSPARFELHLLGAFHATLDGEPLTRFRSDLTRALLAYLAVESSVSHRREALATMFWGEFDERSARASLRTSLSNLRRVLAPLLDDEAPILTITRQVVQFRPDSSLCWIDAVEFDALVTAAEAHPHQQVTHCPTCTRLLVRAADLYQGDFLAGLSADGAPSFSEWRVVQQERWHRQMLTALDVLAIHYAVCGDYQRAQDYARRQLALEPWSEDTHRQLMRVLALGGQRTAALSQYEACRQVLADELGVEPAPETVALYEQIRDGVEEESIDAVFPASPVGAPVTLTEPIPQAVDFVGREEALSFYRKSLAAQNLAVLHGLPGTGKTALAAELAVERQRSGHAVIWITFYPGVNTDLESFLGLLAYALEGMGDARLQTLLAAALQEKRHYPLDTYIHYAANCLLASQATLCLDDVHLVADIAEIQRFLGLLVPRQQPSIVPLIVTSRNEPLFVRGRHLAPLMGLDGKDARHLLEKVAVNWLEDAAFDELQRCTEGNPAFLKFFAAWALSSGVAELSDAERLLQAEAFIDRLGRSPKSSDFLLDEILSQLEPVEHAILERVALCRKPLNLSPALAMMLLPDLESARINAVFAGLERKNLLMQRPGSGAYRLHSLLRRCLRARLTPSPQKRSELHRVLARYYEAADDVPEAAFHHCRAGDLTMAVELLASHADALIQAGQAPAIVALAHDIAAAQLPSDLRAAWYHTLSSAWQIAGDYDVEAVSYLSELLAQTAEDAHEQRYALLLARERAYDVQGARDSQRQDLAALEAVVDVLDDGDLQTAARRAEVALRQSSFARATGDYPLAVDHARRAIDLAQAIEDDNLEAKGYLYLSAPLVHQGLYHESRSCLKRALTLAQQTQDPWIEADGQSKLGGVLYYLGEFADAQACYERALSVRRRLNDRVGEGVTLGNLGFIVAAQGFGPQAMVHYEEALHLTRQIGDREMEAWLLNNLGNLFVGQMAYGEALVCYEESLYLSREIGDRCGESNALGEMGVLYSALGCYEDAAACFQDALHIKQAIGDRRGEGMMVACQGLLAHALGDDEKARRYSRRALSIAQELRDDALRGYALTCLGHASRELGALSQAMEAYREAVEIRRGVEQFNLAMESLAGVADVCLAQGDLERAKISIDEILSYLEEQSLAGADEPCRVYLICYRVLRALDDARADRILTTAYDRLQTCAAQIHDVEMRRAFLENVAINREIMAVFNAHAPGDDARL